MTHWKNIYLSAEFYIRPEYRLISPELRLPAERGVCACVCEREHLHEHIILRKGTRSVQVEKYHITDLVKQCPYRVCVVGFLYVQWHTPSLKSAVREVVSDLLPLLYNPLVADF